jgi:hypothetical protein
MPKFSMKPADAMEGGGAIPTGKVLTIEDSRYAMFDYGGKFPATIAIRQVLRDENDEEYTQYWSVGSPERYTITDDELDLDGPPLNKGCNAYVYLDAAVRAGFAENRIDGPGSFNGTKALFTSVKGADKDFSSKGEGKKEGRAILVMEKVISMPGEAAAKSAMPKTPPYGAVSDEVLSELGSLVGYVISQNGGVALKTKLTAALYTKDGPLAASQHKETIGKLVFSPMLKDAISKIGFKLEGDKITSA